MNGAGFPSRRRARRRRRSPSSSAGATETRWRSPGLWETWTGPDGEEVDGACILTTDANGLMASIHDRMPVILEREDFDAWLECDESDVQTAARLMRPARDDVLEAWPISTDVNKVANDNAGVQTPIGPGGMHREHQRARARQRGGGRGEGAARGAAAAGSVRVRQSYDG